MNIDKVKHWNPLAIIGRLLGGCEICGHHPFIPSKREQLQLTHGHPQRFDFLGTMHYIIGGGKWVCSRCKFKYIEYRVSDTGTKTPYCEGHPYYGIIT